MNKNIDFERLSYELQLQLDEQVDEQRRLCAQSLYDAAQRETAEEARDAALEALASSQGVIASLEKGNDQIRGTLLQRNEALHADLVDRSAQVAALEARVVAADERGSALEVQVKAGEVIASSGGGGSFSGGSKGAAAGGAGGADDAVVDGTVDGTVGKLREALSYQVAVTDDMASHMKTLLEEQSEFVESRGAMQAEIETLRMALVTATTASTTTTAEAGARGGPKKGSPEGARGGGGGGAETVRLRERVAEQENVLLAREATVNDLLDELVKAQDEISALKRGERQGGGSSARTAPDEPLTPGSSASASMGLLALSGADGAGNGEGKGVGEEGGEEEGGRGKGGTRKVSFSDSPTPVAAANGTGGTGGTSGGSSATSVESEGGGGDKSEDNTKGEGE